VQNASLWLELASWQICCYSDPLTRYCFKYTQCQINHNASQVLFTDS